MRYIPLTEKDRKEMLKAISKDSVSDLFAMIPETIRHPKRFGLPSRMDERSLRAFFKGCAEKNLAEPVATKGSFQGAGAYPHFIPSAVDALSLRGEFATSYTPYQAELSQGTLQAIFEFQSMIASLLEIPVANASMYDGASALAEGILMAMRIRKKNKVVISSGVHPDYLKVVKTYLSDTPAEIMTLDLNEKGQTIFSEISDKDIACVVASSPNFYGLIENLTLARAAADKCDALLVTSFTEILHFGKYHGHGFYGADIVTGEAQSFGNGLSFGGPHVGILGCKKEHIRQMPGRIVGETVDDQGNRAYCLTLSTREQHIRRQKATSNICTNHSLCALRSAIHMALLGAEGIQQLAEENHQKLSYLRDLLTHINGVQIRYEGHYFNELCVDFSNLEADLVFKKVYESHAILAGVPLSQFDATDTQGMLIAVTELKTERDISTLAEALQGAIEK